MNGMLLTFTIVLSSFLSILSSWLTERYLDERIAIIGSFAGLQKAHNTGIAFSIPLPRGWELIIVGMALALICYAAFRTAHTTLSRIGFGLIVGGGLGNIADRWPDGLVTDMFQVGTFPIFNVADSCITIGVGVLLLEMVMQRKKGINA